MADKMVFPIGFDLEAAVKSAGDDWEKKYAKRLEDLIAKRPINVKLKLDTKKLDDLDAVKKRLAELKIEPITPETKTAIKELARELQTLAKALEQVQKYSTGRATASPDAVRAARIDEINKRTEARQAIEREKARAAAARAEQAEIRLEQARLRAANAAARGASATRSANREYQSQDGYISRLIKRLAVYAGFQQIKNFVTSVREVTAEFELQRVSLGAIIQDQERANQLFSEIKAFALKSPVSILDLTKYTKQLAAYKIGVDELFETTKKLTDVSVGLGVSMDRVVLAFGQTRATGYLRASEIRQFTEMGVPIVEELAAKLSKMNGELVTAAQVMDMVSKRAISFELVKQVFDDMTSAGGMFYNMQEKQGNTLYGMWAKLGDAASVMYDQVGNTDSVNYAMKETIKMLTDLMKHWRFWGKLLIWGGGAYMAAVVAMKALRSATVSYTAAGIQNANAMKTNVVAAQRVVVATKSAGTWTRFSAYMSLWHAKAQYAAATATNVFSKALYGLWAAFLSNPLGWVILAVTTLVALFADADDSAKQFAQSLSEIEEKYTLKSLNDADNFKQLADAALKAAEGSKEQREKLEELDRTYGQIVGSENLQIDKLREMNGEYQSLIDTIEEYNTKMKYQEREGAIKEYYGGKKKEAFGKFEDELSTIGFGSDELGHEAGAAIAINVQNALLEELEKNGKATTETARKILKKQISNTFKSRGMGEEEAEQWAETIIMRLESETKDFVETLNSERAAIDENSREAEEAGGKLAKIYGDIKRAKEELAKVNYVDSEGKALDTNSFLFQQSVANETMKKAADLIRNSQEMKDALGDKAKELEPMWLHLVDSVSEDDLMNITTINFDAILKVIGDKYPELKRRILAIQKEWGNIAPTNETALQIRQKLFELSNSFDPTLQKMKRFLWDGSGAVDDYLKRLKEQQEELKTRLKEKQTTLLHASKLSLWWNKLMGNDISAEIKELENEIAALDKLIPYVAEYTNPKEKGKKSKSGGSKSDPRLQNLKEEISLVQKLYNEYKQLEKQEGATKAAADMEKMAGASIKALSDKYGIKLPKTAKDLTSALEILYNKMAQLPKKVFPALDKDLRELRWTIEKVNIDDAQKKIEEQLKALSDKISRTKTAREFYDKILSQTGDVDLAANVTMSIYGDTGEGLFDATVKQIQEVFKSNNPEVKIDLSGVIDMTNQRINYGELAKIYEQYQNVISEKNRSTAENIIKDGKKNLAQIAEQGAKLLLKYDEIAQQRVNIEQEASEKIRQLREAEAIFLATTASEQKKSAYKKRTDQAVAGVEADRDLKLLKLKDEYLRFFSAIHSLTSKEAETLRTQVREALFKAFQSGAINADQLKKELEAVDEQFNKLIYDSGSFMEYMNGGFDGLINRVRSLADEVQSVGSEISKMESADQISEGQKNFINDILRKFGNNKTGKNFQELFTKTNGDLKQMGGLLQGVSSEMGNMANNGSFALAIVDRIIKEVSATIEGIAQIRDQLNEMRSDDNQLGGAFWDSFEYLENFNKFATSGWEKLKSGNIAGAVTDTISSIISIFSTARSQKIKKINKEIERQQELLDQLEYAYRRLEKAAEKVFGADYLRNYNQQQKNLQAQQLAYEKQLQAEKSKGKKADKDKIKEYEEKIRDVKDELADMQGTISEKMLGTDLASKARDMAKAYLDAYKQIGRAGAETTKAMKEQFQDMIENMVVEGALAAVMQKALQPMFTMIDNMNEEDFYSESFWKKVAETAAQGAEDADKGAQTLMKFLEQAGISIKDINTEYTGIKRDIAGASEETMSNVAVIGNNLMYYVSPIPGIAANVALIAQSIVNGNVSATTSTTAAGWTDWQQQAMDQYMAIQRNTADTVVECRRAAQAAEDAVTQLRRVIRPRSGTSSFGIQVYM